jgi:hypothetical protein
MTVDEFFEALDGFRSRDDRARERDAWMAHHLLIPHYKEGRAPSINALLGRDRTSGGSTAEEQWGAFEVAVAGDEDAQRAAVVERMREARGAKPLVN